ncbi:hypothetical protein M2272_002925 [Mycobacterium frederiksbergense]|uniref:Tubulin-like protein n=1 Tax=Mycolicibacterium frederiksbergense TaxID=117567 RepID=A0ABT6L000_9MYCO|nr:tubulin-like doman-containing protein [Mycolicibacterium frederiksbergense]MDH6196282.1 hypothetical protein [Mycolicibacterium frederiksbergense]
MRRFLVVGCGGSGGATLAYMMDELRSELQAAGVHSLPLGWQFVHIDVPSGPEAGPEGLPNVTAQGGTYIGCGPQGSSYAILDSSLSQRLSAEGALDTIATWTARNPEDVTNPISAGAGQYRAIGRMITLSKAGEIRERLQSAWDQMFRVEAMSEMAQLEVPGMGKFDPNEPPLVLVVSSMAGGAGASMALDICRLLTLVSGLDPRLIGVFMVTPDIFDSLPASARVGVRANALAMLGEIVASQAGVAREHDVRILRALGQQRGKGEPIPFARVFPVGRYVGADRTLFGDGSQYAVYRGLGRGLAGLMMSGTASDQFVFYDIGNTSSPVGDRDLLGWGNAVWDPLPWGTYGFASLSMGRDRYAQYAAQRLARSCADKLLTGHLQPGNPASGTEQLDALLDSQWGAICDSLGLPSASGDENSRMRLLGNWMTNTAFSPRTVAAATTAVVDRQLRSYLPDPEGITAEQWVSIFRQAVANRRRAMSEAVIEAGYSLAFTWHREFAARIDALVTRAIADFSLPYARGLVDRLIRYIDDEFAAAMGELGSMGPKDVVALAPNVEATLMSLRGVMSNADQVLSAAIDGFHGSVRRALYAAAAAKIADVLVVIGGELLGPLRTALSEAQVVLESAQAEPATDVGLARLATDQYTAWPADADELVPGRFAEANNEVLLINSSEFKDRYELDLPKAVATGRSTSSFSDAVAESTSRVIAGQWPTTGGVPAPDGLLERTTHWASRAFGVDPQTQASLVPSMAQYDVHTRPHELLARARLYVRRPGEAFQEFCKLSLRDYIQGVGASESELAARHRDIVAKFNEALALARPLASVNEQSLQRLHPGQRVEYRYKFSFVPFLGQQVAEELAQALRSNPRTDQASRDNFDRALSDDDDVTRIDIFGSYPNYSPLAFDSLLEPVAQQWSSTAGPGRAAFWRLRRTRPLPASLPMSNAERRAMVGGWFLGQVTGRIQIPSPPYTDPVRIYDDGSGQWLAFPNPLLTPPSQFIATYDWLPAVLEAMLLAVANSNQPPVMSSLRPYHVLRGLFDSNSQDPASGIVQLSAVNLLKMFLVDGSSGQQLVSRIPQIAAAATVSERADAAVEWLTTVRGVAAEYLPEGTPGASRDGAFTTISTRPKASKTPIFRDIAPDAFLAIETLIRLTREAAAQVAHAAPGHDGQTAAHSQQVVIPDGGSF